MVSSCMNSFSLEFYHDEPCCRPYHTFYGDVTCPSQTDYLIHIQFCQFCISLQFFEAVANFIEEFYRHRL